MNRFRSRNKSHGESSRATSREGSRRPSMESDVPALPSFASRTFKRKKAPAPEPRPEIDLTTALPASDDFRTSLLMPKLSARFSMLKEQDDPTSKIGKANDDSVLFPKRASRLDLFNTRPDLSEIAEIDSLRGPIRPPFASTRTESYGSDGTDDGSVMSRARPGEGNTMFGGRQKIYKIPVGGAGSVKNFGSQDDAETSTGANMGGKPIYESDTTLSTFQQLREKERAEKERAAIELSDARTSKEQDRSGSPPYARYNRNRETTSSTNSAPSQSRASTAATSVASQRSVYCAQDNINGLSNNLAQPWSSNPDRPFLKSRRLYAQGLDRDLHDQQASSLHRLGSFNRSRTPVGGPSSHLLHQSKSATNLNDRLQRGGPLYASNGFRAESPISSATPPRMAEFDLGLNDESQTSNPPDSGYGRSPPLSPPLSPDLDAANPDPTLIAALEPNDIGKATASGAFNKPRKQYDESQYLQRQLQLQGGRNTPSPQPVRALFPQPSSLHEQATAGRSRTNSIGSSISRTNSFRAPWMEDRVPRAVPERGQSPAFQKLYEDHSTPPMERSFFTGMNSGDVSSAPESESEADPASPMLSSSHFQGFDHPQSSKPVPIKQPLDYNPQFNHLAEPIDDAASESRSYRSEATITQAQAPQPSSHIDSQNGVADSPTLGPSGTPNGLSGLVRAHLRNDSGQSSIYPEDSPHRSHKIEVRGSIFGHGSALEDQAVVGDDNSIAHPQAEILPPPLSLTARSILEQATALRKYESNKAKQMLGNNKAQQILGGEAPRGSHETAPPWQEHSRMQHARRPSTETQEEGEELAQELAQRRRNVQEKLQTFAEIQSRSTSPAPTSRTHDSSPSNTGGQLGLLQKLSHGALGGQQENPSKAMKMLGIENESRPQQPSSTLFNMREQIPGRAQPPCPTHAPRSTQARDEVKSVPNQGLGSDIRNKSHQRSHDKAFKKHSPQSSKSSSAYSETSSSLSTSRNGSAVKADMENANRHGYGRGPARNGDAPGSQSSSASVNSVHHTNGGPSRPSQPASELIPFEQRAVPPGTPFMINPSNRQAPPPQLTLPFRQNPSLAPINQPGRTSPRYSPTRNILRPGQSRQQSVNKHDISEPTFVSCTSSVDTIDLPPGASLKNGMDSPPSSPTVAPPIPARNSRRKRTQTFLQSLSRQEKTEPFPSLPPLSPSQTNRNDYYQERSEFSDDEPTQKPKQRLRKSSSEGGSAAAKARQQAVNAPSPAMPQSSFIQTTSPTLDQAPYQTQQKMPASAAMF